LHNEGDEPAFTQPRMYAVIRAHPTVRALYAQQLERERVVAPGAAEEMLKAVWTRLDQAKKQAEQGQAPAPVMETGAANGHYERFTPLPPVTAAQMTQWTEELLKRPEGFTPNAKLERLLQRYRSAVGAGARATNGSESAEAQPRQAPAAAGV